MIAYYCCCGRMNCTCGATGCPDACDTSTYDNWIDTSVTVIKSEEKIKPKTPNLDLSFLFTFPETPQVHSLQIPLPTKRMFPKSGYLPKRIRRKCKSA